MYIFMVIVFCIQFKKAKCLQGKFYTQLMKMNVVELIFIDAQRSLRTSIPQFLYGVFNNTLHQHLYFF